eukprot:15183747-Heterocapsa_arctica.AAC.1
MSESCLGPGPGRFSGSEIRNRHLIQPGHGAFSTGCMQLLLVILLLSIVSGAINHRRCHHHRYVWC